MPPVGLVFAAQARPNIDEGMFLSAGRLVAEGQLPYRDFPFAQAPLLALRVRRRRPTWLGSPLLGGRAIALAVGVLGMAGALWLARRLAGGLRRRWSRCCVTPRDAALPLGGRDGARAGARHAAARARRRRAGAARATRRARLERWRRRCCSWRRASGSPTSPVFAAVFARGSAWRAAARARRGWRGVARSSAAALLLVASPALLRARAGVVSGRHRAAHARRALRLRRVTGVRGSTSRACWSPISTSCPTPALLVRSRSALAAVCGVARAARLAPATWSQPLRRSRDGAARAGRAGRAGVRAAPRARQCLPRVPDPALGAARAGGGHRAGARARPARARPRRALGGRARAARLRGASNFARTGDVWIGTGEASFASFRRVSAELGRARRVRRCTMLTFETELAVETGMPRVARARVLVSSPTSPELPSDEARRLGVANLAAAARARREHRRPELIVLAPGHADLLLGPPRRGAGTLEARTPGSLAPLGSWVRSPDTTSVWRTAHPERRPPARRARAGADARLRPQRPGAVRRLAEPRDHLLAELADRLERRPLRHRAHLDQEHDLVGAGMGQPLAVGDRSRRCRRRDSGCRAPWSRCRADLLLVRYATTCRPRARSTSASSMSAISGRGGGEPPPGLYQWRIASVKKRWPRWPIARALASSSSTIAGQSADRCSTGLAPSEARAPRDGRAVDAILLRDVLGPAKPSTSAPSPHSPAWFSVLSRVQARYIGGCGSGWGFGTIGRRGMSISSL